jgi:hypothetical protein
MQKTKEIQIILGIGNESKFVANFFKKRKCFSLKIWQRDLPNHIAILSYISDYLICVKENSRPSPISHPYPKIIDLNKKKFNKKTNDFQHNFQYSTHNHENQKQTYETYVWHRTNLSQSRACKNEWLTLFDNSTDLFHKSPAMRFATNKRVFLSCFELSMHFVLAV